MELKSGKAAIQQQAPAGETSPKRKKLKSNESPLRKRQKLSLDHDILNVEDFYEARDLFNSDYNEYL